MIKTISVLLNEFKNYKNPHDHIRLLVKEGSLIKLKRGLYENNGEGRKTFFHRLVSLCYGSRWLFPLCQKGPRFDLPGLEKTSQRSRSL